MPENMEIGYRNKTLGISVHIRAPENEIEGKHVQSVMLSHFDVESSRHQDACEQLFSAIA
jgi:hypothetical protein